MNGFTLFIVLYQRFYNDAEEGDDFLLWIEQMIL